MNTIETLKDLFVQLGAAWVLWLLFALSIGSVAVAFERWLYFRSKSDDVRSLVATVDAHLSSRDHGAALDALRHVRSVAGAVASAGIRLGVRGPRAAEKGMESAIAMERKGLEARLSFLGTLGNNAPFIGLLGTVIGVILAFEALGDAGASSGAAGAQVASAEVMGAIAEALVATAVGIAVALPAVGFYNYFQQRIAGILSDAEALSSLVVAYLVDETAPADVDDRRESQSVDVATPEGV